MLQITLYTALRAQGKTNILAVLNATRDYNKRAVARPAKIAPATKQSFILYRVICNNA